MSRNETEKTACHTYQPLNQSLLLVLPVPMQKKDGRRYVESQAVNGLLRWADNFDHVTAAIVSYPGDIAEQVPGVKWECIDDRADLERVTVIDLPYGYTPRMHFRHLSEVKKTLEPLISSASYLCFAIGGYFGDWPTVAAHQAIAMGRHFAVWTDRVESRVIRYDYSRKRNLFRRLYGRIYGLWVGIRERRIIQRATLGLFHGRDTYDAYAHLIAHSYNVSNIHLRLEDRISTNELMRKGDSALKETRTQAFLVHDIHLSGNDRIPSASFEAKASLTVRPETRNSATRRPLIIGYAGRAAEMKAPLDWLAIIKRSVANGIDLRATWLGDGPLLPVMRDFVDKNRLDQVVHLPGFVGDRRHVVEQLRSWDILLFTHVTPESPRILLEALVSGTPIVGYDSPYARDLVQGFGEEYLVPIGAIDALAAQLVLLDQDRRKLVQLMRNSYAASEHFNDTATFRHRSDLIKRYVPPWNPDAGSRASVTPRE